MLLDPGGAGARRDEHVCCVRDGPDPGARLVPPVLRSRRQHAARSLLPADRRAARRPRDHDPRRSQRHATGHGEPRDRAPAGGYRLPVGARSSRETTGEELVDRIGEPVDRLEGGDHRAHARARGRGLHRDRDVPRPLGRDDRRDPGRRPRCVRDPRGGRALVDLAPPTRLADRAAPRPDAVSRDAPSRHRSARAGIAVRGAAQRLDGRHGPPVTGVASDHSSTTCPNRRDRFW